MNWFTTGSLGQAVGWTLVHSLWQLTMLALVLWLFLSFVPRRRSELRYGLLIAGLVVAVMVTGVTFWWAYEAAPASTATESLAVLTATGKDAAPLVVLPESSSTPTLLEKFRQSAHRLDPYLPFISTLWLTGVLLLAGRLLLGLCYLKYLQRFQVVAPPKRWLSRFEELCRQMKVSKRISLLLSGIVKGPVTFQLFRPVILLPASILSGLSPEQVEVLILHELAHIRRHDFTVNLLQTLVEILLFFHPAIWWLSAKIREEREYCCDQAVMATQSTPFLYAEALTQLQVHQFSTKNKLVMSASGNASSLTKRVFRLFGQYHGEPTRQKSIFYVLMLLLTGVLVQSFITTAPTMPPSKIGAFTIPASMPEGARTQDASTIPLPSTERSTAPAATTLSPEAPGMSDRAATLIAPAGETTISETPEAFSTMFLSDDGSPLQRTALQPLTTLSGHLPPQLPTTASPLDPSAITSMPQAASVADTLPLFVIDGVVRGPFSGFEQDLDISPEDIASISVIKDSTQAVQQYGMKARYGVIIVTTKGKKKSQKSESGAKTIRGRIIDEDKNPLVGVNVIVKDTRIGTITDLDGNFVLQPPSDCVDLAFSYVGMKGKVLENICKGQNLGIRMRKEATATETVTVQASRPDSLRIVAGKVTNEQGQPLIGTNVLIQGTTSGTITDFEGKFQLRLPADCATLIFSYVGYASQVISEVCGGQNVEVKLLSENTATLSAPPAVEKTAISDFKVFPNPSAGMINASFQLDRRASVTLRVYTTDGKLVTTLVDQTLDSGPQQFSWNGGRRGSFVMQLEIGEEVLTRQVVIE